ncbi:hypothetical protein NCCP2222_33920 [Sporosarcina sp. NCCP-2222]|nr:hypothetical protein NCCP2222_33920 [Sporosarcina sp. NCCP-2222]
MNSLGIPKKKEQKLSYLERCAIAVLSSRIIEIKHDFPSGIYYDVATMSFYFTRGVS